MKMNYAWLCPMLLVIAACGDERRTGPLDAGSTDNAPDSGIADSGAADTGEEIDLSEALFRPDHVLEISITLAPEDWARLRVEPEMIGTPKITCGSQPTERAYTYFPGEITVDGETISNVGVRKKGGFGSISTARPGLKIKASEYVAGQRISGLKRLTLNNNVKDETLISQCLGYGLFSSAGIPASRCSFAHVTVNGEDLGIYSNVETIKKPFLRRHFVTTKGASMKAAVISFLEVPTAFSPRPIRKRPTAAISRRWSLRSTAPR